MTYKPARSLHRDPALSHAAHIYGGTVEEFLRLSEACANWTSIDRARGIQAAVDDESYLQRCASRVGEAQRALMPQPSGAASEL